MLNNEIIYWNSIKICEVSIMADFEKMLEEANSHYEKHELDEALEIFEKLYNEDYKRQEILPAMIDLYLAKDDFDNANKSVDAILKEDPDNLNALSIKSFILTSSDELDEALDYAEKIIDLDPNVEEGYLLKISILHLQQREDEINKFVSDLEENAQEVLEGIEQLTGLSPEDLKTGIVPEFDEDADVCGPDCDHDHHHHDAEHLDIDDLSEEEVDDLIKDLYNQIDESIEIEIERYLYKANTAMRFQRFDEALELIDEALKIEDNNLDALLLKSTIYFNEGKFDDALNTINKVIEYYPTNSDALTFKGFVYINMEDFDNAEKSFKAALEIDDTDYEVWRQYTFAIAANENLDAAIDMNQKAIDLFPESSDLWYDRFVFLTESGETSKAEDALVKSLELNPDQLDYEGNSIMDDLKNYMPSFDEVMDDLENNEDVELSPEEQRLYDLLNDVDDKEAASELVLSSFQEAISAYPDLDADELFNKLIDIVEEKLNKEDD